MANWCLPKNLVSDFKEKLKNREIDPFKMAGMTSEERHALLESVVGKENATQVNALFESKLLLKNQKQGFITWAKTVTGITPEQRRDLFTRIEKLDKVLNPTEERAFLQDLASTKLGVGVTQEEAKTISTLSKTVQDTRLKRNESTLEFPSEQDRLAYGRAKVALANYVNEAKQNAGRLSFSERLKPSNYVKNVSDVAGNAKSIQASMDDSAIFRQGWKTLMTNPLIWQKNARKTFVDMVKTWGGKNVTDEVMADIVSRPNYDRMVKAKLAIGNIEESFPGSVAEKIPALGRLYKGSEAAYTGFVYRQRADIFDKYMEIAQKSGVNINDKKALEPIASMINSLTGRGNFGKYEGKTVNLVNNVFFSPRFVKSQIDLVGHVFTGAGGSNFVRKQAALNLLKVVSGTATVLAIADAVKPGSVEWDPRSSDFGKIKIGDTRFDVTGGMSGLITLAARLKTGAQKNAATGVITPLDSGKPGSPTTGGVVWNFFSNKLSPVAKFIDDLTIDKTDFQGNPHTLGGETTKLFTPIGVSNYQELVNDPNAADTLLSIIADGLGISSNTYGTSQANWSNSDTKEMQSFVQQFGDKKLQEANNTFNTQYSDWLKKTTASSDYQKLSDEQKQQMIADEKKTLKKQILDSYGFVPPPREKKQSAADSQSNLAQSLIDVFVEKAYASDDGGIFGSTTYSTDFKTGTSTQKHTPGLIENMVDSIKGFFGWKKYTDPLVSSSNQPSNKPQNVAQTLMKIVDSKLQNVISSADKSVQPALKTNLPYIVQALKEQDLDDPKVLAYALATISTETSNTYQPVREGFYNDRQYGYPEGFTGKSTAKKLGYSGGESYYGRGFIQITNDFNYDKYGQELGIDLKSNPDLALKPDIAAQILAHYFKDRGTADLAKQGKFIEARGTINQDGNAKLIADKAKEFLKELTQ